MLDILVQNRLRVRATKHLLRKLMERPEHVLRAIIHDKLHSYGTASRTALFKLPFRQSGRPHGWDQP